MVKFGRSSFVLSSMLLVTPDETSARCRRLALDNFGTSSILEGQTRPFKRITLSRTVTKCAIL